MIKQFVEEAYRVLKPEGGTLVVNTISPEQCSSPWYFSLLTQARQILSKKYVIIKDNFQHERERERERADLSY